MKIKDKQALRRKIANRNDKEMEKFKTDIAMRTINELQVITAYVLQSEFGFGNKRLAKFLTEFHKVHYDVATRKVRLSTIAQEVEDKTGLCYDIDEMEWRGRRSKQ